MDLSLIVWTMEILLKLYSGLFNENCDVDGDREGLFHSFECVCNSISAQRKRKKKNAIKSSDYKVASMLLNVDVISRSGFCHHH